MAILYLDDYASFTNCLIFMMFILYLCSLIVAHYLSYNNNMLTNNFNKTPKFVLYNFACESLIVMLMNSMN